MKQTQTMIDLTYDSMFLTQINEVVYKTGTKIQKRFLK